MPLRNSESSRFSEQLKDTTIERDTSHAKVESNRIQKYGIDMYYREHPQKYEEAKKVRVDSIDFSNEHESLLRGMNLYEENAIKAKPYVHTDVASYLVKNFLDSRETDKLRTICERIDTDSVGLDGEDEAIEAINHFIEKYKSVSDEDELQSLSFQHCKDQLEDAIRGNDRIRWVFGEYLRQEVYRDMPLSEKVLFDKGLVITDSRIIEEIKFDNREFVFLPQEIRLEAWRNREISEGNYADALTGMASMWYEIQGGRSRDLKELKDLVRSRMEKEFRNYYIQYIAERLNEGRPDSETTLMLARQKIQIDEWSTILGGTKKFLETGEESIDFPFKVQIHYPHLEQKLQNLRVLERVESEPKKDSNGSILKNKKNNIIYQDKEGSISEFYATNEPASIWEKFEGKSIALVTSNSRKTKENYKSKINYGNFNAVFNYNARDRSVIERNEEGMQVARWYLKDSEILQSDNIRIFLDHRPNYIGRTIIAADIKEKNFILAKANLVYLYL